MLNNLGLVIGRGKFDVFAARAKELIENRPELVAAVSPLLDGAHGHRAANRRPRS
jgi:transposase